MTEVITPLDNDNIEIDVHNEVYEMFAIIVGPIASQRLSSVSELLLFETEIERIKRDFWPDSSTSLHGIGWHKAVIGNFKINDEDCYSADDFEYLDFSRFKIRMGMVFAKYYYYLLDEFKKIQIIQGNINLQSIPEILEKVDLRHSIFLLYELGVIGHLKTELKNRGINIAQETRNYLPNLLATLMNITEKAETIRKEISQHDKIKVPLKALNSILGKYGLEVSNLK